MQANILAALAALHLAACTPSSAAPPPSNLRDPDATLMRPAAALPDLPPGIKADATMWDAYGKCRVEHADVADRHSGLVAYVEAIRGRISPAARQEPVNRQ